MIFIVFIVLFVSAKGKKLWVYFLEVRQEIKYLSKKYSSYKYMSQAFKNLIARTVNLDEGAWQAMEKILHTKTLKRKENYLREGETCKNMGFIVKGYVRLYYLVDGKEITKDFSFENSFCGSYASFSMNEPSRFNVVAMEDLELLTFERNSLFEICDRHPAIQKFLRLSLQDLFIRKEMRESAFLLDPAEKRYNDLLAGHPQIIQRVPLKYLASYLGMSAETISRIRKKA